MGKYGKRVEVSTNLNDYMIGVMAPSGFGKTTLMYKVGEQEFGPDGYIILDMAMEDGTAALQGAVSEKVPNWSVMRDIVTDIVENKQTDYPNLKVVVLDTLDAAFEAAEAYCVKKWNAANAGKQGFVKATSINSVEGGFGKGLDKTIEIVRTEITRLKEVGVAVWWTAHVKEKDQNDLFTGESYTTLTANMTMKYFNSIKNSSHIVAFGYFDRNIKKQEIGDTNPITKKKKERKAVVDETRKIKFRDDAMVADAKSRFAQIVDEIPLDTDEFIKAIKEAIIAERGGVAPVKPAPAPVTPVADDKPPFDVEEDEVEEKVELEYEEDVDFADDEPKASKADRIAKIKAKFSTASPEDKKQIKTILITECGANAKLDESLPDSVFDQIETILDI